MSRVSSHESISNLNSKSHQPLGRSMLKTSTRVTTHYTKRLLTSFPTFDEAQVAVEEIQYRRALGNCELRKKKPPTVL